MDERAPDHRKIMRGYKKRKAEVVTWIMGRMNGAAQETRTAESLFILAIIERAFIDAFLIFAEDSWRAEARRYLSAPSFRVHLGFIGIDYEWALEQVATMAMAIKEIETEESHEIDEERIISNKHCGPANLGGVRVVCEKIDDRDS